MNKFFSLSALTLSALVASPLFATSASSLSSFEGIEEPTVIYHLSSNSFTNDSYVNIVDYAPGEVRMYLRYNANNWWDGDRNTTSSDRGRAEVKGLGVHQLPGETFDYVTKWKTNSTFKQNGHFCHFFQLKGVDGDNGAPLITMSADNGGNSGALQYCSGTQSGFTIARSFTYTPGASMTLKARVKTTTSSSTTGSCQLSINGDSLSGKTNIGLYRTSSTEYRPKWGFYRGVGTNDAINTSDYMHHALVSATKL
jgi:hypothetical protein